MSDEIDNLLRLAREARRERRLTEARRHQQSAVALLHQERAPVELAVALRDLGELERRLDGDAPPLHYEKAVAILRETDHPLLLAHTIRHLGVVHYESGRVTPAERCYDEALALYRAHDETRPLDLANAIRSLAVLKSDSGERDEATRLWREAHDLYELVDVSAGVAESAGRLAAIAQCYREAAESRPPPLNAAAASNDSRDRKDR